MGLHPNSSASSGHGLRSSELPSLVWERIGKKHVINLLNFTSPAELVTVFTPTAAELEWGQENLEPHGVALYDDYEQMLSHEGVQAVVVAMAAVVHAEEVILAIDHNLQVSSNPRWKSPG
jgi:predicted dehydrogenase